MISEEDMIEDTVESWENRTLGADEKYVLVVNDVDHKQVDEALGIDNG
jgi:arginine/ornithine N-succinyltransferase beta subunit